MGQFLVPTSAPNQALIGKESDIVTKNADAGGDQPVVLLDRKSPEYAANLEAWLDLSLLYEGGVAIKKGCDRLLKKRPREDQDVFMARKERFTYQNILGTALGWYGAAMFQTSPEILIKNKAGKPVKDDKFYTGFLDNCDGNNVSFVDFFRKTFSCLLNYGAAWVLVDLKSRKGIEEPVTLEDERSRGLLDPHLVLYTPLNIINWQIDKNGGLNWVVIKTTEEQENFLEPTEIVDTWYYYDRENYRVYEDRRKKNEVSVPVDGISRRATLIDSGKHSLAHKKQVPVRRLLLSEGLWLANRAYLLLIDHLNQDNTLAWSLFMSNLAIPIIIGDVDGTNMTATEAGYMQFPAGTTYSWSEPQGVSFQHSANRIDSLREEAFRCMHLQAQGRSMHATPAMQSGRSKQLEMVPANDILGGMGDDIRCQMQQVLTDVIDARRDEAVTADVRGFQFEDDMTTEEVFAVTSLIGLGIPSKTFEKMIYKKVAKAWMPDANRAELEQIYAEINAGPTRDDRMKEDLQNRIDLTKAGMEAALTKKLPGGPELPPGRGGDGPKPPSK